MLLRKGVIRELSCGANFSYLLEDPNDLMLTEYKVLQNGLNDHFLKCMKMKRNGKVELYYLTKQHQTLLSMLPILEADTFLRICRSLLQRVSEIKPSDFLDRRNVNIDFDKVFVDKTSLLVYLTYLPITPKEYASEASFENELRTKLIQTLHHYERLHAPKTMSLQSDLSDGTLSIENVLQRMQSGFSPAPPQPQPPTAPTITGALKLVAVNTPNPMVLSVGAPSYMVGKNPSRVEGVLHNSAVSNVHCKFTKKGDTYFLEDVGSTNGTYLNQIRLVPHMPVAIKQDDFIGIANQKFQVQMG